MAWRGRCTRPRSGCVVAAPGKIERPAADKVKTDQRDAERVLRLLMIDGLDPVRVPTSEEEALRDVVRAREAVRGDLMRARQRLSKLLLRHDVRYEDTVDELRAEMLTFDNELRGHLRYVLAGSIRNRIIGAVLLGIGILLAIAGAIVGALQN